MRPERPQLPIAYTLVWNRYLFGCTCSALGTREVLVVCAAAVFGIRRAIFLTHQGIQLAVQLIETHRCGVVLLNNGRKTEEQSANDHC